MSKKSFFLSAVTFFAALLFVVLANCNQNPFFGVGADVDTVAPTLSIDSHKNGAWVSPSFTLSGSCKDNVGVTKVEIKQIKRDGATEYTSDTWNAAIGNGKWSYNFNFEASSDTFKTLAPISHKRKK